MRKRRKEQSGNNSAALGRILVLPQGIHILITISLNTLQNLKKKKKNQQMKGVSILHSRLEEPVVVVV